jgi:titin
MRQHLDMIRRVGGGLLCVAAVATFCAIAAALPTKDVASTGDLFMVEEIACARRGDSFIPGTIQRGVFTSITHEMRALRRQMSSLESSTEVSRQDLRQEYRTLSARRALERTICDSNAHSHPDRVLKKKLSLSSKAFRNNATIPDLNSCWGGSSKLVGSGTSPDIAWANVPSNAARLALLVTDSETNVIQWFILVDKKSSWFSKGLPANVPAAATKQIKGTFQSKNDFGVNGYSGPCPPDGATRRYLFELLALKAGAKGTAFGTTPSAIRLKLKKNTIASATYRGVFTGKETQPALPTPEPTATPAPVPPGAPGGLTGARGNSQVALSWSAPSSDGGSAITDYIIEHSTNSGASWIDFDNGTSAATSVTVTGLANGTAYIFRVAATNGFGTSAFSDPSESVTPAVPPDAPTGVSGTSGDTQVSLTWTAPASDGGSAVTDYTIQYSSDGGTSWSDFSDETSSVTSATVTGLVNTTAYVFRVAAVNAAGTSAFSESSSSITPTGPPHAPTGLSGTAGNGQVSLTWTAPVSNGGSALTDYEVQFSSDGGINWSTFTDGTSTATAATVTGLANGTQYLFRVAGINAVGTGTFSDPSDGVTPVTTPEPPTGVSGIAGNTEVVLSWSEPSTDGGTSITDYTVQYSSNSGGSWTTFADGTNASTGATVTGLSNGTEYVFRVAAVNAVGSGSYSAASEGVTPVTTPDAPISLTGSAGDAQVSLSWTAPASNGGSAVTDYEVEYSLDGGSSWSPFADGTSTTTSATVTGLTNGTSYVFRVAAVNVAGTGSFSSNSATLTPATTPDAPTGLSGTAGNTQVELTWSAPAIDGGSAITDYVVQYSADSGTLWNTFSDGTGTLTSATVTSLVNGTPYVFRVAAVNLVGTGSFSDASSSITPITTPGAPTSLSGTAGDSQVSLSWTAPSSDGGSAITDYVVEYSSDSGTSWVPFSDDYSGVTGATVSGLSNGTAYIFRVAAVNEAGTGSYSTSSASVTPLTVPDAPTSLMGSAGDTQVALTWSAPTSDGGSAITDYVVELSADSGTNWSPFSDGTSTATGATVTGLTNGTAYIFRVAAINEAGTGAYSTDSGPLTPATTPDAPTSVSGTAGNTEVSLTWSAPAIDGGSAITDYEVEYSSDSGTTWTPFADGTSTATSATVTGLSNGTAYIFKVAAVNAVGTGSFSSNSGSVTPANTPDAPTSVSGTAGNSEVSLTWSAPASDGGNAITDYEIEYSSDSGGTWTPFSDGTSTSTSATVTGLSNGTAYIFRVAAVNEVGTSSFSTESSSVTPANTPDAPTGVSGTAGNTEVSLTWSAPAIDGGSAITDYEVEYSSDSGTTWTPFADGTSTTTSTTVTGLSNGTAYIFRVAAVNAVGTGSFSTESSSVTPANTPDAPTSVTGTAGNAEVSLTWTAPAGDGGSAITDYEVEYSSDSGTTWTPFADGTSTSTSATVTGLSNGTAYIFKVAAVNEVGTGSFSSNSGSVTPANTPDAPTGVSGTAGNAEVSLTWSAPAGDGGSAITDYEVEYSPDSGTTWTPFADGTSTTTSATVTGLSNGTAYIFKVAAVNEVETGSFSSNSGSVTPATTPDAPTNLSGFWAHSLQIDISWAAPLNDGGSAITDYEVEESINGGLWSPVPGDAVSTYTSYSHQSPNSSFVYSFRVRAVNAVGPGPYEEVFVGDYGG